MRPRLTQPLRRASGGVLAAAFLVAIGVALQLSRQPGVPAWDSMWQEDAGTFLYAATHHSLIHDLVTPYNGYLHWAPRVIAHVTLLFPAKYIAALMAGITCLIVSLISLYVYGASARVFAARWARATVAVAPILLPAAGFETNANVTNLHWYLMYGAFWVCAENPRTIRRIAVGGVIVWFAVLSDPATIVFFALALLQVWRDGWRRRSAWVVPALFLAGFALQLGYGILQQSPSRYTPSHWGDVPGIYGLRVAGSFLLGDQWIDNFWNRFGFGFTWICIALVAALFAYAVLRSRDSSVRLFAIACMAYSVLLLAASCMLRGTGGFLGRGAAFGLGGSRYMLLPILFLVAIAGVALERRDPRVGASRWRVLQIGLAAWVALVVLHNYAIVTTRSGGPSWKAGLAAARQKCEGKLPGESALVYGPPRPRRDQEVGIYVSPNFRPVPPWAMALTCARIEGS